MAYSTYQDQTANVNMADKATYDQFETYLGIATAQQIATEQGNAVRQQILATLQTMASITSPDNNVLNEIKGQVIIANGHLLNISETSKKILTQFGEKMESISMKLNNLNRL